MSVAFTRAHCACTFRLFCSDSMYRMISGLCCNRRQFQRPAKEPSMASGSRMLAEQRRRKILEFIEHKGQITVRELASRFSVSAVTARGDLDSLCSSGLAIRSHGGAVRKLETGSDGGTSLRESRKFADVARLAKVSLNTVSRAAQGNSKLAPSVQASVFAVARDLGVNLARRATNRTITLVLGNRETVNEFQSKILLGAEGYCTRHDWALQFISFRSDLNAPLSSLSLPEILTSSSRPSGVILTGTHSANILAALSEKKIPFSLLGNKVVGVWQPEHYDCVFTDDVRGSADIRRYLVAQGHRKVCDSRHQRVRRSARCAGVLW